MCNNLISDLKFLHQQILSIDKKQPEVANLQRIELIEIINEMIAYLIIDNENEYAKQVHELALNIKLNSN